MSKAKQERDEINTALIKSGHAEDAIGETLPDGSLNPHHPNNQKMF